MKLQNCFVDDEASPKFPSAWGRVENDYISFLDELDPLMPSWCTITLYLGKHYFRCRPVKVLNRQNKVPLFVFQGLPGPIGPVGPKGVRVSYLNAFLSTVLLQFDFYLSKLLTLVLWWDHCVCLQTRTSAWHFSDTFLTLFIMQYITEADCKCHLSTRKSCLIKGCWWFAL